MKTRRSFFASLAALPVAGTAVAAKPITTSGTGQIGGVTVVERDLIPGFYRCNDRDVPQGDGTVFWILPFTMEADSYGTLVATINQEAGKCMMAAILNDIPSEHAVGLYRVIYGPTGFNGKWTATVGISVADRRKIAAGFLDSLGRAHRAVTTKTEE